MSRREEILCKQVADGGNTSGRVSAKAWSRNLGAIQMNFTESTNSSHSKNLGNTGCISPQCSPFRFKEQQYHSKSYNTSNITNVLHLFHVCLRLFTYCGGDLLWKWAVCSNFQCFILNPGETVSLLSALCWCRLLSSCWPQGLGPYPVLVKLRSGRVGGKREKWSWTDDWFVSAASVQKHSPVPPSSNMPIFQLTSVHPDSL